MLRTLVLNVGQLDIRRYVTDKRDFSSDSSAPDPRRPPAKDYQIQARTGLFFEAGVLFFRKTRAPLSKRSLHLDSGDQVALVLIWGRQTYV